REEGAENGDKGNRESACAPFPWKVLALAVVLFSIPLFGYLYLPIRAADSPAINAGDPRRMSGLVGHVTGAQYRSVRFLTVSDGMGGLRRLGAGELPSYLAGRGLGIVRWMGEQIMPHDPRRPARGGVLGMILAALSIFGFVRFSRSSPLAGVGFGGGLLLNLVVVLLYTIPDIEVYQLPLWIGVCAFAPLGLVAAPELFRPEQESGLAGRRSRRAMVAGGVMLALAAYALYGWFPPEKQVNKSEATQARDYAVSLMKALPEGAVVFTRGDYDIYPLWYLQVCENARPDVAVIGSGFVFSRWYAAMLRENLPPGVEVFVGDEPPSSRARWLVAFLGGMVAPQVMAGRPTFITAPQPGDPDIIYMGRHFELVPRHDLPAPLPVSDAPPLVVYEIRDPSGFSAKAVARFREMFGAQVDFSNVRAD
ncbi:hypothetical protein HQ520_13905, partial [bacterium]|nr:hypothetical protein [bacterium]